MELSRKLSLIDSMHREGINARYLSKLKKCDVFGLDPRFTTIINTEIIARKIKNQLRELQRRTMSGIPKLEVIVKFLNRVFIISLLQAIDLDGFSLELLIFRLSQMTGIEFRPGLAARISERSELMQEDDIVLIQPKVKFLHMVPYQQGVALFHQAMGMIYPAGITSAAEKQQNITSNSQQIINMLEQAEERFAQAIQSKPDDFEILTHWGMLLSLRGKSNFPHYQTTWFKNRKIMSEEKVKANYDNEPYRNEEFVVNYKDPFNAEPRPERLIQSFITPTEHFYVRNHAPVPDIDPDTYTLKIDGLVENALLLTLNDLKTKFEKVTITAQLQCAGNRRTMMSDYKKVKGVGWGIASLSNGTWSGCRLRDVLLAAKILPFETGAYHACFWGLDFGCPEDNGLPYGSSISVEKAMDINGDVLLAYEMNGKTLTRDHGFPVRVIAPGIIGARSVKWLDKVTVSNEESTSFFQRRDYKIFHSGIDWHNIEKFWDKNPSLQELSIQSAICVPAPNSRLYLPFTIFGYATSGGGRKIERVDISLDGGESWDYAELMGEDKGPVNKYWAWTLFKYTIKSIKADKATNIRLMCRAWDSASNTQPKEVKDIWNLRGVMNNSWHYVDVTVDPNTAKL
ncbi:Putative sulfite oxidase [Heterostelium album PN500]|uniref:Sulfite oxidase n=1 Tax=Heterostelium pallidum (strain ATCC 26659 / Pp 5 / PN500) TaxID=670386 RepID=D3AWK3_HETP5|nr:Putative sulfite oxidase [Heterostelium album PN500]EFA86676.1 Putative sulfite oxidase [Heterostelium album PN500]|eukprot:XP_020438780.1 Putative sulfite oxidase [Heterostelium album PN500]